MICLRKLFGRCKMEYVDMIGWFQNYEVKHEMCFHCGKKGKEIKVYKLHGKTIFKTK